MLRVTKRRRRIEWLARGAGQQWVLVSMSGPCKRVTYNNFLLLPQVALVLVHTHISYHAYELYESVMNIGTMIYFFSYFSLLNLICPLFYSLTFQPSLLSFNYYSYWFLDHIVRNSLYIMHVSSVRLWLGLVFMDFVKFFTSLSIQCQ